MLQCLQCLVCSLAPPLAKVSGSHQNNLIMRELLIMQEPLSGRSWTSKVFNIVINLDTYQFMYCRPCVLLFWFKVNKYIDKKNIKGLAILAFI